MILRFLAAILLIASVSPARAAVTFSGYDYTFEAGAGELQLGKTFAGTLTFADEVPSSVALYLLLTSSIFFCIEGECGGDPNAGQEFLPIAYAQTGNELAFKFTVPGECFSGDCDKFVAGQYQYDFDIAVLLFTDPIVLIGDFSDPASFTGSITAASSAIPEPSAWAMLLLGFGALGWRLRGRMRSSAMSTA